MHGLPWICLLFFFWWFFDGFYHSTWPLDSPPFRRIFQIICNRTVPKPTERTQNNLSIKKRSIATYLYRGPLGFGPIQFLMEICFEFCSKRRRVANPSDVFPAIQQYICNLIPGSQWVHLDYPPPPPKMNERHLERDHFKRKVNMAHLFPKHVSFGHLFPF